MRRGKSEKWNDWKGLREGRDSKELWKSVENPERPYPKGSLMKFGSRAGGLSSHGGPRADWLCHECEERFHRSQGA